MKRYVFSLHRVLRVRTTQETLARQALRAAAEHAAYADDDYDLKARNYEANVAGAASLRGTALNLLAMREAASRRARDLIEAQQRRDAAHAELGLAQDDWAQAKQRVGALEHVDERQRRQHFAELEAAEQAESDDLVTGRAARGAAKRRNGRGEAIS